jgi:hypothetical protein
VILSRCHDSLAAGGRLLIVDAVVPERATDDPGAVIMDVYMMILTDGRERSQAEYDQLLATTGFVPVTTRRCPSGVSVIEAVKS